MELYIRCLIVALRDGSAADSSFVRRLNCDRKLAVYLNWHARVAVVVFKCGSKSTKTARQTHSTMSVLHPTIISLDILYTRTVYYIERYNKFHRCKTQRRNLIFGLFLSLQLSFLIEKLKWLFVGEGRFIRSGDTHDFWLKIWIKLNNIPLV